MTPAQHVRHRLALARATGLPFHVAWQAAVDAVAPVRARKPGQRDDQADWRVALDDTVGAWRRAYERQPPESADSAVARLASG